MVNKELKVFNADEVRRHDSAGDLWITIDGGVYDLARFVGLHPGGIFPLMDVADKDTTDAFYGMHRQDVLHKYDRYKIAVPYAEPSVWQGFKSPYYKEKPSDEFAGNVEPDAFISPIQLPGGISSDGYDYFHEFILHGEFARFSAPSVLGGMAISVPTILNFSPRLRTTVAPEVLSGRKRMALAITEPYTGSDVANIKTTAVTLLITFLLLLIERSEGVDTKTIKTSYSSSAGTAYVTFDSVKVPVKNLLGEENKGFHVILSNFNHERWSILCGAITSAQRMLRSVHNWIENLTYQMNQINYGEQSTKLAGPIALCKYQVTRVLHDVSDDTCQIFGGRAITKTNMGRQIELLQRTYKFSAILGGSEEIMADLGVRQAMRNFPIGARL